MSVLKNFNPWFSNCWLQDCRRISSQFEINASRNDPIRSSLPYLKGESIPCQAVLPGNNAFHVIKATFLWKQYSSREFFDLSSESRPVSADHWKFERIHWNTASTFRYYTVFSFRLHCFPARFLARCVRFRSPKSSTRNDSHTIIIVNCDIYGKDSFKNGAHIENSFSGSILKCLFDLGIFSENT